MCCISNSTTSFSCSIEVIFEGMLPNAVLGYHNIQGSMYRHENDDVLLEIQHMVGLEVLETPCIYLYEGYNMAVTWCHSCALSLEHYGTQEQDLRAYTQQVAKF